MQAPESSTVACVFCLLILLQVAVSSLHFEISLKMQANYINCELTLVVSAWFTYF